MESLEHKESPDENAIYRFELEGISVRHPMIRHSAVSSLVVDSPWHCVPWFHSTTPSCSDRTAGRASGHPAFIALHHVFSHR